MFGPWPGTWKVLPGEMSRGRLIVEAVDIDISGMSKAAEGTHDQGAWAGGLGFLVQRAVGTCVRGWMERRGVADVLRKRLSGERRRVISDGRSSSSLNDSSISPILHAKSREYTRERDLPITPPEPGSRPHPSTPSSGAEVEFEFGCDVVEGKPCCLGLYPAPPLSTICSRPGAACASVP